MKAMVDSDVALDLMLDRPRFAETAARVFTRIERGDLVGLVCAASIPTIYYVSAKANARRNAHRRLSALLKVVNVALVDRSVIDWAIESRFRDFEDAIVAEAARRAGASVIVTRNLRDFIRSPLQVYTPTQLLAVLDNGPERFG